MQNNYDIGIIGGGLAGLSLAIQSANAGYNVILFEKEKYPFHKVCGEYISFESKPFLEKLGVPLDSFNLPNIHKLETSDGEGNIYTFPLTMGGFGISRFLLDNYLSKIARGKGVTLLVQTKVTDIAFVNDHFEIKTSSGDFTCNIAAGCFGKRSNIDVKLNRPFITQKANRLNNYVGVKYHIKFRHPADTIALHNFEGGYCGISKIENDNSCLCYLTTDTNLQTFGSIEAMEKNVLYKNRQLKRIFEKADFLFKKPVTISNVSFSEKKQVEEHILMLGDAAGLITPLCGNGMSMALHASKIAFQEIDQFLQNKITRAEMEDQYTSRWKKQFSTRLWAGRMVQRFFGKDTSTQLFLKTMNAFPYVTRKVIETTHGNVY